jgi:CRISPR-associated endonuclease/helicase Cas3
MSYTDFFKRATRTEERPDGLKPFPYQCRLAEKPWPELLDVPTGMGKTAAVALAWLWKRGWREGGREASPDAGTPRRLVYCLPMRVLVEQTERNACRWLENLAIAGIPGKNKVSVHLLMGGSEDVKKATWADYPEEDAILIGTQDMLLSRALMRGYGMSRYQWPVHFAWLHNDALWVFDEVQLMEVGLSSSVQFELFHDKFWQPALNCRFLWMSATPGEGMFATRDRRDHKVDALPDDRVLRLQPDAPERREPFMTAKKSVEILQKQPNVCAPRSEDGIVDRHQSGRISLVVVNTVFAAQDLYKILAKELASSKGDSKPEPLLLHGRMRPCDREQRVDALLNFVARQRKENGCVPDHPGLIVVATQVIEAGVDISVSRLWSEIAPWTSIVQRLGRLNRDGKQRNANAYFWMPKTDLVENTAEKEAKEPPPNAGRIGPYEKQALSLARRLLDELLKKLRKGTSYRDALDEVSDSKEGTSAREITHESVIRPHDFLDLFSTEPDLAGGFTDVSQYVRGADQDSDVHVFWGEFKGAPPEDIGLEPDIVCRVPSYLLKRFLRDTKARAWEWDTESGGYSPVGADGVCPGMTLLLARDSGGYREDLGWTGAAADKPRTGFAAMVRPETRDDERWSETDWLLLPDHLRDARAEAKLLVQAFGLRPEWKEAVICAASWHDVGKAHERWQRPLKHRQPNEGPWAKFKGVKPFRPGLRHEAASALAAWQLWLGGKAGMTGLAVYLMAAHHGKVRTVLRSTAGTGDVFGVLQADVLPRLSGWYEEDVTLDLSPRLFAAPGYWIDDNTYEATMPSWTAVVSELLGEAVRPESSATAVRKGEPTELGPFALAFLEALVIAADHRASAAPGRGQP